ncbi:MAG: hypothetical protein ABR915_10410 [Thermoguttaceae bacterium]
MTRAWRGEPQAESLTEGALEGVLRATDPAARLVWPRVLRRVIRQHTRLPGFGLRVPHAKSYVIPRGPLSEIAEANELGFFPHEEMPRRVILLERLGPEELAQSRADAILLHYWRLLLHARVHLALEEWIEAGRLSPIEVRQRIERLGTVAFDEIRNVLSHERFLLPPYDDTTAYIEFAAVYVELRYFAPALLPSYFPALEDLEEVDRVLAEDLDIEGLFLASRPAEAPDPREVLQQASAAADEYESPNEIPPHGRMPPRADQPHVRPQRSEAKYRRWMEQAERAAAAGNLAGAAIRRARAISWAPHEFSTAAAAALRNDLHRLVNRLQAALDAGAQDPRPWRESLLALACQTPRGLWTVEARLLYDLQKVCVDHERGIYAVDVISWAISLGRRPIKRPLPSQREVLMAKHLQSAARRLAAARLSEARRRQLGELLRAATQRTEANLRAQLRLRIDRTLDEVRLRPCNLPERVAKKKLVEELLDRVVDRGFLRLGDLRDALSRNNLKLPDCGGAATFFHGDPLLEADRRLSLALDGVYERGEFYLRWLQRFSSLAFGTRPGRFLTRYLAVPFGGAYLPLAFVDYYADELWGLDLGLNTWSNTLLLGVFLLGIMHVGWFRRGVWGAVKAAGRVVRFLLIDSVRWLAHLPLVEKVLRSRLSIFLFRFLVKPLLPTIILWRFLPPGQGSPTAWGLIAAFFVTFSLVLNSRLGRNLEELAADVVVEGWHRIGLRILTGLFALVMDVSRRVLQAVEQLLYTVDEWLRFKSGQSPTALLAKAALGAVWFWIAYVVRFLVNVVAEPQLNPIKHFPVVTVSHKIMLPQLGLLTHVLALTMNRELAGFLAFLITVSVPGICGFLVWEFRENWRLYAANRPKGLRPSLLGPHGETMPRLLRPGFHSGTLPKRFAKLRRAQRRQLAGPTSRAVRRHREALRKIELALRRYVERELLELFRESRSWNAAVPAVGEIRLATNRVRVALALPAAPEPPAWITFQLAEGSLVAEVTGGPAPLRTWPAPHVAQTALLGLFKTGGADLVRLGETGGRQLAFSEVEIPWDVWVAAWEGDPPGLAIIQPA